MPADSYREAERYILDLPKFTKKNNVEDTGTFLKVLGSPEEEMKIIHVAGTNGKGSVCAYLCSMLAEGGYSVGMFTSPHLVEMRERFRTDKGLVTEEQFVWGFDYVMERLGEMRREAGLSSYIFRVVIFDGNGDLPKGRSGISHTGNGDGRKAGCYQCGEKSRPYGDYFHRL